MQDVERTFNNSHRRGDFMTTDHTPHSELPSDERILEYVQAAYKVLHDELPAGHKLWKSWAFDLADNVLVLARKLEGTQEQLEATRHAIQELVSFEAGWPQDPLTLRELIARANAASSPASVLTDSYPPPEDVERAAELARERGWKDIGGQGVVEDPATQPHRTYHRFDNQDLAFDPASRRDG